jgi:hypothetical protein
MMYEKLIKPNVNAEALDLFDEKLKSAVDSFVGGLDDRDKYIFEGRTGLNSGYKTLEEVGLGAKDHSYGKDITRERVRQIQEAIFNEWRDFMPVRGEYFSGMIDHYYDLINADFMPRTRSAFQSDKDFNRFLAVCTNTSLKHIEAIYMAGHKGNVLDSFWATTGPSPIPLEDIVDHLGEYGFGGAGNENRSDEKVEATYTEIQARNLVFHLLESGHIVVDEEGLLSPRKLNKATALAHAAQSFGDGAPWLEIQQAVNEGGYCARNLPTTRLDFAMGTAVDNGWIYQSERGTYAPVSALTRYFKKIEPMDIVHRVKDFLIEEGEDSYPLAKLYNAKSDDGMFFNLEYFIVRYAIKQYGEIGDVYFSGLSGSDMIGLHENVGTMSKQEVILQEFEDKTDFTLEDVVPLLRSNSPRHAAYLIDKLIREGEIVKTEMNTYTLAKNLNAGIDLDAVMQYMKKKLLKNRDTKIMYDSCMADLKEKFGFEFKNQMHFNSVLRSKAEEIDAVHEWRFSSNGVTLTSTLPKTKEERADQRRKNKLAKDEKEKKARK